MKPRARRVTIATTVLGVGVLAVLVVAHWGTVRDHVEAWHFQLTRETVTIDPDHIRPVGVLAVLAVLSRVSVVFDPIDTPPMGLLERYRKTALRLADVFDILQESGYRVLQQRFPRKAYVLIRSKSATP